MKRILFSAVGSTDPIAGQHDGAILHIARNYDLDEIYLYYSKEMCEIEEKDDRYLYCLDKLKEKRGKEFAVRKIYRPELTDVHIFDFFLTEFKTIIDGILQEDCELYLNVSSGTPAMKSALQVIGTICEKPVTTIQVATPTGKYNEHREDVKGDYEVELQWELDMDNQETYKNRCSVSSNVNLAAELKKEIIKKQVNDFDYLAALSVAKDVEAFLNPGIIKLLEAAASRIKLDRKTARLYLKDVDYKMFTKESGDEIDCFEYLLLLRIKMLKEEYIDFLRGITPLFASLLERTVKKETSIDVNDYCISQKKVNGATFKRWDERKVSANQFLRDVITADGKWELRTQVVTSEHLVTILERKSDNATLKKLVGEVRDVEKSIRNPVAHCITYMTEDAIKKETGYSTKKIFEMLTGLSKYSGIEITDEDLQSYERCNEKIISLL